MREDGIGHEGTCLKVTGKRSVLVWDNYKSHSTILCASGYALPEAPINQGQDGLDKFHSMLEYFSRSQIGYMTSPQSIHHSRGRYVITIPLEPRSQTYKTENPKTKIVSSNL